MITEVEEIKNTLQSILKEAIPPLQVRVDTETTFEVAGTKETMQGKQKVDGIYFASVVPKPKDVRLYFFPVYTHVDQIQLSDDLRKHLKGKSCFHIKKLSPELVEEIRTMVKKGVELYAADDMI